MPRLASLVTSFSKNEIDTLFKRVSQRFYRAGLDIKVAVAQLSYGRLLIIVPKKFGNAPARNLIKRRLRALFYEEKLYECHKDVIIIVRPEARFLSFEQLKIIVFEIICLKQS